MLSARPGNFVAAWYNLTTNLSDDLESNVKFLPAVQFKLVFSKCVSAFWNVFTIAGFLEHYLESVILFYLRILSKNTDTCFR